MASLSITLILSFPVPFVVGLPIAVAVVRAAGRAPCRRQVEGVRRRARLPES